MGQYYYMKSVQQTIWNEVNAYRFTGIGNIGGLFYVYGDRDPAILEKSISYFVKHVTTLHLRVGKNGKLYTVPMEDYKLIKYDFSDKTESEFLAIAEKWMREPMELYDVPLFDLRLIKRGKEYVFFDKYHHLIIDGVAVTNMLALREKFYFLLEKGEQPDMMPDCRYIRLLQEQLTDKEATGEEADQAASWFEEQLQGADYQWHLRRAGIQPDAKSKRYIVPKTLRNQTEGFCRKHRVGMEAVFFGALIYYVCKVKTRTCGVIGRIMANRKLSQLDIPGMFANTLPVMARIEEEDTFVTLCKRIKKTLARVSQYSDYGYHELLRHLKPPAPLFDISVSYLPARFLPLTEHGKCVEILNGHSEVPLKIFLDEKEETLELDIRYRVENYSEIDIDMLTERLLAILGQGISEAGEGAALGGISIFGDTDRAVMNAFNRTKKWVWQQSLPERFAAIAKEFPDVIALKSQEKTVTYQEAAKYVEDLYRGLKARGVGKGTIAGIHLERSIWIPIAMLAILRAGAAFLPIGIRDTKERIREIEKLCDIVITDSRENIKCVSIGGLLNSAETFKCLPDNGLFADKTFHATNNQPQYAPEDIAYYMFTSGTTGQPKAAMISHESLACRLEWMADTFGGRHKVLQKTVNTFDVSVWELLLALLYGGTVCLLPQDCEKYPDAIANTMETQGITMVHFVPSMLTFFLNEVRRKQVSLPNLRCIIASGEELHPYQVEMCHQILPGVTLYNLYGPTECTIDVTWYPCEGRRESVPIGRPVYNTHLFVLDREGNQMPPGIEGELCVMGTLVGKGYYQAKAKGGFTEFRKMPAYLTGDRVKLGYDGQLYFLGRKDRRVKLRGMRIDLAEIENAIMKHTLATHAVVFLHGRMLACCYSGSNMGETLLRQSIAPYLPHYCLPAQYQYLEEMPTGPNGKLDRGKIMAMFREGGQKDLEPDGKSGESGVQLERKQQELAGIISPHLELKTIAPHDNLLSLGLDSLSIVEIVTDLEERGWRIRYEDFYYTPTIAQLVKMAATENGKDPDTAAAIDRSQRAVSTRQNGLRIWDEGSQLGETPHKKRHDLLLCIPYGGGEPEIFYELARSLKEDYDTIAGVDLQYFLNINIEQTAKELVALLDESGEYTTIEILACCVGAALAMELARILEGKAVLLILCESLPFRGFCRNGKIFTWWDILPDSAVQKALNWSRDGEDAGKLSARHLGRFRMDVKKAAAYLRKKPMHQLNIPVALVFGEKDPLTFGYRRKYQKWKQWIKGGFEIHEIAEGKHFLLKMHRKEITAIIKAFHLGSKTLLEEV